MTIRRCPEPQIPPQVVRDGIRSLGTFDPLRPDWAIGPCVGFFDPTNGTAPNSLNQRLVAGSAVILVSHLSHNVRGFGGRRHGPGFFDGVSHRFLDVYMLAELNCCHGHRHVHMVRGRNRDGIDVGLLQEFPPIVVQLGARVFQSGATEGAIVHVADRHDILTFRGHGNITRAFTADTHGGNVQLGGGRLVGGFGLRGSATGNGQSTGSNGTGLKELATIQIIGTHYGNFR